MIDLRQKMAEHANRLPRHDRSRELLFAAVAMLNHLEAGQEDVTRRHLALLDAVGEHHAQRADDRCHLDDAALYRAAGLPAADIRVGDREEMLKNCARFIDRRCAGGHWPTYAELEVELCKLRAEVQALKAAVDLFNRRQTDNNPRV